MHLQISDLSFRRHVLVQALIITDFLLSLSPEAKQKLATLNASNKSVIYADQLSEENVSQTSPLSLVSSPPLTHQLSRQNGPQT